MFCANEVIDVNAVAKYSCAPGRDVVNQLEHRRAFVAGCSGLAREHRDGAQIARGLRVRQVRDAVGQHADLHAGAVEPGQAAEDRRAVRDVRLRRHGTLSGDDVAA